MSAQESRRYLVSYALASWWMGADTWLRMELPKLEARGYRVSARELESITALVWGGFFDGR